jgi:uncharacterized membrane protein
MTPDNGSKPEPTLFCATITPHRSLGRTGFLIVMTAVGAISFTAGMAFVIAGAWPVMGFFGLDALLIYWAFRANYAAARAVEIVTVTASELHVDRVNHRGHRTQMRFNPLWVQLEGVSDPDFGLQKLFVVSRERRFAIAGYLSPAEKEGFAAALRAALNEARRGPTRTVLA